MHSADLRHGLLLLAEQHDLAPTQRQALFDLAGIDAEPAGLRERLPLALGLLAALLVGLGVVMSVAANWGGWPRWVHFALLQLLWALALIAAWRLPRAGAALGLTALLMQGGLLAYFGQTYQTGADPWQLFAYWALLTLPLALGVRSDWVWAPWTLVFTLAVVLWAHAHGGHRWEVETSNQGVQQFACLALASVLPALSLPLLGSGRWAERTQALWTSWLLLTWGLAGLFGSRLLGPFWLSALFLALGLAWAWWRSDLVQMAFFALALDTWLVCGLARLLVNGSHASDLVGELLLVGLIAAGLLTVTAKLLMRRAKEQA